MKNGQHGICRPWCLIKSKHKRDLPKLSCIFPLWSGFDVVFDSSGSLANMSVMPID